VLIEKMFSRSTLITALTAASLALAGPLQARKALAASCLPSNIEGSCFNLVSSCLIGVNAASKSSIWHNRSCVSAATCFGVGNLEQSLACQLNTAVTNPEQASLDYTIYAAIVGDCAYASGGCPITQQNFIDFYYGSLTAISSGTYPSSPNTVIAWYQSIAAWTATGNTVPYTNFNDWLHYSSYPVPPVSSSTTTVGPTTVIPTTVPTTVIPTTSGAPTTTPTVLPTTVSSTPVPSGGTTIFDSSPVVPAPTTA